MKSQNPKIILTLFSIMIGIFISTQIKMKLETITPVTVRTLQSMKDEINSLNNEIAELNNTLKVKQEQLAILENIAKGDDNIINVLLDDIKHNKILAGKTALEGPGIIIKMYDNPEERPFGYDLNEDVIHDVDILNIINDLRRAGAEAISVNNERVVATSEIKCGGPIIRINGRSSATPFIIKAIGDPKVLYAAVNAPGTYGDLLKIYNIGFETTIEDSIYIPAYNGDFEFRYAKPVGEDD
ncbi:MAG TPA: DUF881 domain-containing protein [Tissierellaceae bacterium]